MKPYPTYKATGVKWLPQVPTGWEFKKLKHCFSFSVGGTPTTAKGSYFEGENTWVTIADMGQRVINESKTGLSDEGIVAAGMIAVPKGSLLYSFKLSVGKVAFAGKDLFTNEAIFSVLPSPDYDLAYLYFSLPELLLHSAGQNIYGAKIFNQELLKNAFITLPPLPEQRAIAAFLDHKTAQLDQLVAQKQQMLGLLQEERAALINNAVTRGLDAAAPLRDSGIEWLGAVPAHWEVKRLKYLTKFVQTGSTPPSGSEEYQGDDVNWFGPADFGADLILDGAKKKISQLAVDDGTVKLYEPTTVLMIGIGATVGKIGVTKNACASNQQVNAIKFLDTVNPFFGAYYLRAIVSTIVSMANAATLPIINQSQTKDIWCVVPPKPEQEKILTFINENCQRFDTLATQINQELTLLQEYRAALIAEAVTGQIDVRDHAATTSTPA